MKTTNKKGQIQLTFNWIYIVIAGALILLFFIGIVVRQAKVSEERLSQDIVRIMDSILMGAGVSEKTKNFIDTSGLADYTLYFGCSEGVSEFGIMGKPARSQNVIDPIFAPKEIQSHQVIVWSLPYHLPFKVVDFLIVTSYNTRYYVTGNDAGFINEFLNATDGFNREYVQDLSSIGTENKNQIEAENKIGTGNNLQFRIIDSDGSVIPSAGIPPALKLLPDKDVSAVVFSGTNLVDFYQKEGSSWKKMNPGFIDIISLGGERDAAKYAAIFAGSDEMYQCNMKKAFKRLEILTEVYGGNSISEWKAGGKLGRLAEYYSAMPFGDCIGYLTEYDENAKDALATLNNKAATCQLGPELCLELISAADELKQINTKLRLECVTLY